MKRFILAAAIALATAPLASAGPVATPLPVEIPPGIFSEPVGWGQTEPGQSCGANWLQGMVGRPLSYAYATDAAMNARILRPGMITNMMYVAERLNFHVDEADTITHVTCG